MTNCQFPIIKYQKGHTPYEWGLHHGSQFQNPIKELVEIRRQLLLQKNPKLKSHLDQLAFEQWEITKNYAPELALEIEGIKDGAKSSLTDIVILNNYTDFRDIQILNDEGCSSIYLKNNQRTMAGQTWDMHKSAKNYLCVIESPEAVILSVVGCVGLMGMNQFGLMIGVNNINTTDARVGMIWPCLVRKALQEKTYQQMRDCLMNGPVTSGHNYIIASKSVGEHLEITPTIKLSVSKCSEEQTNGAIFHTNHCLAPQTKLIEDQKSISSTTHKRYTLLEKRILNIKTLNQFVDLCQGHEGYPMSICSHYQSGATDPSFTCGGGALDFDSGEIVFWRGCPVEDDDYIEYRYTKNLERSPNSIVSPPYFYTWAKQNEVHPISVEKISDMGEMITPEKNKIIDLSSISYQAHFGMNPPKEIIEAITLQLQTIPIASPKAIFPQKNSATNELLLYLNRPYGKIFYTTGGAESVENALKMAREFTGKKIILTRKISYHGATLGALDATGDWRHDAHQVPGWCQRIPEPTDTDAIQKTRQLILDIGCENIAGFLLETITGGNGVIIPSASWYEGIQNLCHEFKLLLILDEVVCGFHRTGLPFGFHHYPHLKPDLITMAKGITGGIIPFGAVWANTNICQFYDQNIMALGLTNYAHPLGIAAMRGVLSLVKNPVFIDCVTMLEREFHSQLNAIQSSSQKVVAIRKIGLLAAIDFSIDLNPKIFMDKGLYIVVQKKRLVLAPSLTMPIELLIKGMEQLNEITKSF